MLAVMIALAIITAVLNPLFLGGDNLRNNVRHISLISLFALGEAMVIIAGGIDLSVGSIICIIAVTTSYLTMYAGFGIGAAVAFAHRRWRWSSASAQGAVIARLGVPPFVVTLGSMLLLRGVAEVLTGGTDIGFQGKFPGFRFLGEGIGARACRCRSGSRWWRSRSPRSSCTGRCSGATATRSARTPRRRGCRASRCARSASSRSSAQRVPVGRRRHPLRRVPAGGDAVARQRVRAARRRGGRARRLLAAGRARARCSACSSAPASCRSPSTP